MDSIKSKKRGAPKGSKNNTLKPGEEGATSFLHLRCKPSEKAAWLKAAEAHGGLSAWAIEMLNQAAGKGA